MILQAALSGLSGTSSGPHGVSQKNDSGTLYAIGLVDTTNLLKFFQILRLIELRARTFGKTIMKKIPLATLLLCVSSLPGCVTNGGYSGGYQPTVYLYDARQDHPAQYIDNVNFNRFRYVEERPERTVSVPESWHVGSMRAPVSAKDQDSSWVSKQSPTGYTIEITEDEKAALVANKLTRLPKTDRTAEVRYKRNGKQVYKGVYGSYGSQEEAQKALDALPDDVKSGAGVTNWGSLQSNADF